MATWSPLEVTSLLCQQCNNPLIFRQTFSGKNSFQNRAFGQTSLHFHVTAVVMSFFKYVFYYFPCDVITSIAHQNWWHCNCCNMAGMPEGASPHPPGGLRVSGNPGVDSVALFLTDIPLLSKPFSFPGNTPERRDFFDPELANLLKEGGGGWQSPKFSSLFIMPLLCSNYKVSFLLHLTSHWL